ncbi:MAG TPA: MFS transporter [Solirubrobacteraceae bacterium]|nr:MFS transporter [Solirubrobacteraceae bacterium]
MASPAPASAALAPSSAASPLKRRFNPWLTLVIVCVAQFMVVLDATIVNVAMPSIQKGLHFSRADLQWVINGYTLLFGGFLLLGGRAADLLGRRRLFTIGVTLFSLASAVNAFAQSSNVLVAGRALQGLGAALVSPAALSIITTTFTDPTERTRALGVWSAIAAGGAAVGLLMGGILTDLLSWRWVFIVNLPVGIGALIAALRYVPESRGPEVRKTFDLAGAFSVTAGLVVLVFGIVKTEQYGWGSPRTLGPIGLAAVLLGAFFVIEQRSPAPLVRLSILRIRTLAASNLALLFVMSGMMSMFFFASLYVQEVLGYSPLKAGLAFLPVTVGIGVGAGLAQPLIKRAGARAIAVGGLGLATAGMALLLRTTVQGDYPGQLLLGLMPLAIGMGLVFVPITLLATANVHGDDAGLASGLYNTSQQVGGALGLAILSTLAASRTSSLLSSHTAGGQPAALVSGYHLAFGVGAGLLAFAALLLIAMLRRHHVATLNDDARPVLA